MSIKKCISCEYAVIQKNYDRITKCVIACRKHQDIFAPECEYNTSNALNALDCVDTISRAKVIEDIDYWIAHKSSASRVKGSFTDGRIDAYCRIKSDVRLMPSAEPRWIPVSERLPDDLAEVNVTWVNHKPESYYESIKDEPFTATAVFYKGKWYWWTTYTQDLLAEYGERCNVGLMDEAIEVSAWMPLPQPWKGER